MAIAGASLVAFRFRWFKQPTAGHSAIPNVINFLELRRRRKFDTLNVLGPVAQAVRAQS